MHFVFVEVGWGSDASGATQGGSWVSFFVLGEWVADELWRRT
jgi:hypothetical protein